MTRARSFKNEILHELKDMLRREMDKIRDSPAPSPEVQRTYERTSGEILSESPQSPRISFREETIPSFDGYNIPLSQFVRACRRARKMIPASAEVSLTKILINKTARTRLLRGRGRTMRNYSPTHRFIKRSVRPPKRYRPMPRRTS